MSAGGVVTWSAQCVNSVCEVAAPNLGCEYYGSSGCNTVVSGRRASKPKVSLFEAVDGFRIEGIDDELRAAGVTDGDVLIFVNNQKVDTSEKLIEATSSMPKGTVLGIRKRDRTLLEVTL